MSLRVKNQGEQAQQWLRRSTHNKRQNTTVIAVKLQCSCNHYTTKDQYLSLCWGAARQKEMLRSCSVHGSVSSAARWSFCGPLSSTVSQWRSVFRHYHCLVNIYLSKVFDSPPSPVLYCKCHRACAKPLPPKKSRHVSQGTYRMRRLINKWHFFSACGYGGLRTTERWKKQGQSQL